MLTENNKNYAVILVETFCAGYDWKQLTAIAYHSQFQQRVALNYKAIVDHLKKKLFVSSTQTRCDCESSNPSKHSTQAVDSNSLQSGSGLF